MGIVISCSHQKVYIPEMVFLRKQGIAPIQQSLQLSADSVVIDGRSKYHHIGIPYFFAENRPVILLVTAKCFLAGQTSGAESQLPACQGNQFRFISCLFCSLCKSSCQPF